MVLGVLGERWARFKAGPVHDWGQRMEREQDALDDLRRHPGFDSLLDTLDAEIAVIFDRLLSEEDPAKAEALRQQARAIWRVIRLAESRTRAKEVAAARQAEIERIRHAATENQGRHKFVLEAARRAAQSSP